MLSRYGTNPAEGTVPEAEEEEEAEAGTILDEDDEEEMVARALITLPEVMGT